MKRTILMNLIKKYKLLFVGTSIQILIFERTQQYCLQFRNTRIDCYFGNNCLGNFGMYNCLDNKIQS